MDHKKNPKINTTPSSGLIKKNERIDRRVRELASERAALFTGLDPCYSGWFTCFNLGEYYEAHDVLEHLWLKNRDHNHAFYKGLIQLAGAFVHLKKQHERPWHAKDGRRLAPASRLFKLALHHLESYGPHYQRLDLHKVRHLTHEMLQALERGEFKVNPWHPDALPQILPDAELTE